VGQPASPSKVLNELRWGPLRHRPPLSWPRLSPAPCPRPSGTMVTDCWPEVAASRGYRTTRKSIAFADDLRTPEVGAPRNKIFFARRSRFVAQRRRGYVVNRRSTPLLCHTTHGVRAKLPRRPPDGEHRRAVRFCAMGELFSGPSGSLKSVEHLHRSFAESPAGPTMTGAGSVVLQRPRPTSSLRWGMHCRIPTDHPPPSDTTACPPVPWS